MSSTRKLAGAACALFLMLSGCADKTSRTYLVQPGPGEFAITGRVRAMARLAGDQAADSLGVQAFDDVSGLRVRLTRPDGAIDSTLTRDGAYEFRVDQTGAYRVSCALFASETLAVQPAIVTSGDVSVPLLTLLPEGVVVTYPNPFDSNVGVAVECTNPRLQTVGFEALTVSGVAVRTDSIANYPAGYFHYHWVGLDDAAQSVPNGMYWVAVRLDGLHHADLVLKQ